MFYWIDVIGAWTGMKDEEVAELPLSIFQRKIESFVKLQTGYDGLKEKEIEITDKKAVRKLSNFLKMEQKDGKD